MFGNNHGIVRINYGALESPAEKILGMMHEILIQSIGLGDQNDKRFPVCPAYPASSLPRNRYRARVAHQNADIQSADINAQFQGAGGDYSQILSGNKLAFDFPALFRKKSGPIGADLAPQVRTIL